MLDFDGLKRFALSRILSILPDLLPGGEIVGNEYRCADLRGGKGRSVGVNLSTGVWSDFASGESGGDLIALVAKSSNIKMGEAYQFLADKLVYTNGVMSGHQQPANQSKPVEKLATPPVDVAPPKLQGVNWCYRDFDGRPMFFIERVDIGGKKQFYPTSWSESSGCWVKRAWPNNRPLYGLELLSSRPDAPILVCEGEKAAEMARKLYHIGVVVTWSGGAKAWSKTDWSPLYNRAKITLWPDADDAGVKAMTKIAEQLATRGPEVKILSVSDMPDGWDAADAVNDGLDAAKFMAWARPRAKLFAQPSVSNPDPPHNDTPMPHEREAQTLHGPDRFKKSSCDTASQWPGEYGFYDLVPIPTEKDPYKVKFVPMYNELAKWCFANKNICVTDKEQLRYDGKKWDWLEKTELANYILQLNMDYLQPAHHDNFIKQLRATCYMKALGINPELAVGHLNVENGIVNIADGTLVPHDYRYKFRYVSPIVYDQKAECPRWEQFLCDTFESNIELIDLAQRLFGYVLIGGRPFLHKAFVLYGSGRNGKSTFLDVLRAVIGRDAYSTVSMGKLDKEFSLVNLEGKLANIVEETPNEAINAEVFKTLVGGGEVTVAHKGMDEYQLRCDARFVFACNDMPIFKDRSVGLDERLVFMPFNRYIPEEERDTTILDKLYAELPGILNWAMDGAKTMATQRIIPKYEILNESKEAYKMETNPLYAWFREEIIVSKEATGLPVGTVYRRYVDDVSDNGNRPFSKDKFSKMIRKYIQMECRANGINYDQNLKSKDQKTRLYDAVFFRNEKSLLHDSSDSSNQKMSCQKRFGGV